jgi:predicted nuclease of predicted toxin-antitoxin system
MKLLFDQNISPKLTKFFDNAIHILDIGLDTSDDLFVWEYAKSNSFTIVTKDSDFNNIVALFGFPPKVIWLRRGNCSTMLIKEILFEHLDVITLFINDTENGILSIY